LSIPVGILGPPTEPPTGSRSVPPPVEVVKTATGVTQSQSNASFSILFLATFETVYGIIKTKKDLLLPAFLQRLTGWKRNFKE